MSVRSVLWAREVWVFSREIVRPSFRSWPGVGAPISAPRSGKRSPVTTVSPWRKFHSSMMPTTAKACGQYLNSILAVSDAFERGFDEALLLDMDGKLAEGSGENLFVIKDGVIYTNKADDSIPDGNHAMRRSKSPGTRVFRSKLNRWIWMIYWVPTKPFSRARQQKLRRSVKLTNILLARVGAARSPGRFSRSFLMRLAVATRGLRNG